MDMIKYNRAAWDDIEYLLSRFISIKKIFEYVSSFINENKSSTESTLSIGDLTPDPVHFRTFGDIYLVVRCTMNLDYQGSVSGETYRLATPFGGFKLLKGESLDENRKITTCLINALDADFENVTDDMYIGYYDYENNTPEPRKRTKYIPKPGYHFTSRFYRVTRIDVSNIYII